MNSKKRIALPIAGSLVAVFAISLNLANKTSQSEIASQSFYDEEIAVTTTTTTTVPNVVTTISSVTEDTTPSTSMTNVSLKRQLQAIPVDEINECLISTEITASTSEISKKSETNSTSKKNTKKKKKKKKNKAKTTTKKVESSNYEWDGPVLNSFAGIVQGPSGNETFYNLDMSGVIGIMQNIGYDYSYWVRSDGVKMFGDYVMVAADLSIRPRGSLIPTSLGMGIVCDTGGFVSWDNTRLDIATTW